MLWVWHSSLSPLSAPSWNRVRLTKSSQKPVSVRLFHPLRDKAPLSVKVSPQPSTAWPPPPSPWCSLLLLPCSPSETRHSVQPNPPPPRPLDLVGKSTWAQSSLSNRPLWSHRNLKIQSNPEVNLLRSRKTWTHLAVQIKPRNQPTMFPWAQSALSNRTGWPSEALKSPSNPTWMPSWVPVDPGSWMFPWVQSSHISLPTCPWARCSRSLTLRTSPWWVQTEVWDPARTCPWTQHKQRQEESSWCLIPGIMNWSLICCAHSPRLSPLTPAASPGSATSPILAQRWPSAWVRKHAGILKYYEHNICLKLKVWYFRRNTGLIFRWECYSCLFGSFRSVARSQLA